MFYYFKFCIILFFFFDSQQEFSFKTWFIPLLPTSKSILESARLEFFLTIITWQPLNSDSLHHSNVSLLKTVIWLKWVTLAVILIQTFRVPVICSSFYPLNNLWNAKIQYSQLLLSSQRASFLSLQWGRDVLMHIYINLYLYFLTPQEGGRKWKIKSCLICKLAALIRVIFCKDIGRSAEGLEILCEYCRDAFGWSTENCGNFLIKINHHIYPTGTRQGDLLTFYQWLLLLSPANLSIIVRSRGGFELVFSINLYKIY